MKIMSCPVGRRLAPCRPHKSCYLGTLHTWRNYCAWSVVTSLTICRSQNKFENKSIWLHFNFQLSNISKISHIPRQENVRAIICSCVNVLPNLSRQNGIQRKHRLLYQLLYPFSRNKYWPPRRIVNSIPRAKCHRSMELWTRPSFAMVGIWLQIHLTTHVGVTIIVSQW